MWILLVAIGVLSFGKLYLFQRFLITDPNSTLINAPFKKLFRRLPVDRKIPVIRRANRMLGLLNTGTLLIFNIILVVTYASARMESMPLRLGAFALWGAIALLPIVPLIEIVGMRRMILKALEQEGIRSLSGRPYP